MSSGEGRPRRSRNGAWAFFAVAWLKKLVLPPTGPLILAIGGLVLKQAWLTAAGLALLWLVSMPLVGLRLLRSLERHPAFEPETFVADADRDAIVVLDGGRYHRSSWRSRHEAQESPGDVKPETLERLRHAARIARSTGLPILATGNGAGELMGQVLREDFAVPCRWLEASSRNTQENADFSAALLEPERRRRVVLVTHAWHMPRAARAFERAGLEVVPAPCAFSGPDRLQLRWLSLMPSAGGLLCTRLALHELIGLVWYAMRYRR